jgi:2'-5' RNA ligase
MTTEDRKRRVRSFLAVPLPETIIDKMLRLQQRLGESLSGLRWTKPSTMHLTLRFFGDIEEELLEKIGEIMLSVGRLHAPFRVELKGVGAFPSPIRARVVWLGIAQGKERLTALHADLDEALQRIGIPGENRPFSPHLTLGRSRGRPQPAGGALEPFQDTACGTLPVERIVLFESRLQPQGALHLPRKTVFLGDRRERAERTD